MKCRLVHLTGNGIHDEESTTCARTKRVLVPKYAMEMGNRGAGSQIYLLHRAVGMIALVRHLGMDKKDNTVVGRVKEMEHVLQTDTSHLQVPLRRITWYHGDLWSLEGYVAAAPLCTRYAGMMILGKSLSQSYILECSYHGLRIYHARCRRRILRGTSGRWTLQAWRT